MDIDQLNELHDLQAEWLYDLHEIAHVKNHATVPDVTCPFCLDDDERATLARLPGVGITITDAAYLRLGALGRSVLAECVAMLERSAPHGHPTD